MLPNLKDDVQGISAIGTTEIKLSFERNLTEKTTVPCMSVSDLSKKIDLSKVDYLNIDIEGYDEQVIKDFDFDLSQPTVISIEDYSKTFEELTKSSITNFLNLKGYKLVGRVGPTSIFLVK